LDGYTNSDHNAIIIKIDKDNVARGATEDQNFFKYNVNKINWEKFNHHLILPDIEPDVDVDLMASRIEEVTKEAIAVSCPPPAGRKTNIAGLFWCAELERL